MRYPFLLLLLALLTPLAVCGLDRPNVLWITCEDITTMLGCYGDPNAETPHLDRFAERSIRFTNAYATAPVCVPARSGLILSQQASSMGTQHLRGEAAIPDRIRPYPKYLREAGYYATNNDKEDYNFEDSTIWDDSSKSAHWKNGPVGKPFFAIFNLGITHQSQIFGDETLYSRRIERWADNVDRVDPQDLKLPPYFPDTPKVRELWARYYTNVRIMDFQFGRMLEELEKAGLAENTIVFFYSDHGTGMPRAKRALYDSGLKVPLLVHIPDRWAERWGLQMGSTDERMVSFLDLGPSLLSLCGVTVPETMAGRVFMGEQAEEMKPYVYGTSDRVDEAFEMSRTVRTARYRYIRNFFAHLPLLQPNFYTDQSEIMAELFRVQAEGIEMEHLFIQGRPVEELYDVEQDPYELNNLADDPAFEPILDRHRGMLVQEILESRDTGFMMEPEMLRLANGTTPYDLARDNSIYPLSAILDVTELMVDPGESMETVVKALQHENGFVRFWGIITAEVLKLNHPEILRALTELTDDPFPTVRVESAKYLVELGFPEHLDVILNEFESDEDPMILYAARAFQLVAPHLEQIPSKVKEKHAEWEADMKGQWQGHKLYAAWALRSLDVRGKE